MSSDYPGDDLVPDAPMIYDRTKLVKAPAVDIWPFLIQLGKGRGGWYLPHSWERFLPASWRATRTVNEQWQTLGVGDRIADYGLSSQDYFDVMVLEPNRAIVYRSERLGTVFTWALLLHEDTTQDETTTTVHLRFRGRIVSTGLKRKFIIWAGDILDHWSTAPMLAGLAERVEQSA